MQEMSAAGQPDGRPTVGQRSADGRPAVGPSIGRSGGGRAVRLGGRAGGRSGVVRPVGGRSVFGLSWRRSCTSRNSRPLPSRPHHTTLPRRPPPLCLSRPPPAPSEFARRAHSRAKRASLELRIALQGAEARGPDPRDGDGQRQRSADAAEVLGDGEARGGVPAEADRRPRQPHGRGGGGRCPKRAAAAAAARTLSRWLWPATTSTPITTA